MKPTSDDVTTATVKAVTEELADAVRKIKHCLGQLSDEQLWWRPADEMNSIGNLLLHLCGNVRQWIICGIGEAEDKRDRPAEFAARGEFAKDELLSQIDTTISEAKAVLDNVTPEALLARRRIQGFDVNGLEAVFHSVSHFRGHTQEIVHVTRVQLGDAYQFDFVPSTPEQGA